MAHSSAPHGTHCRAGGGVMGTVGAGGDGARRGEGAGEVDGTTGRTAGGAATREEVQAAAVSETAPTATSRFVEIPWRCTGRHLPRRRATDRTAPVKQRGAALNRK